MNIPSAMRSSNQDKNGDASNFHLSKYFFENISLYKKVGRVTQ
jgi:hypothetical protein